MTKAIEILNEKYRAIKIQGRFLHKYNNWHNLGDLVGKVCVIHARVTESSLGGINYIDISIQTKSDEGGKPMLMCYSVHTVCKGVTGDEMFDCMFQRMETKLDEVLYG